MRVTGGYLVVYNRGLTVMLQGIWGPLEEGPKLLYPPPQIFSQVDEPLGFGPLIDEVGKLALLWLLCENFNRVSTCLSELSASPGYCLHGHLLEGLKEGLPLFVYVCRLGACCPRTMCLRYAGLKQMCELQPLLRGRVTS